MVGQFHVVSRKRGTVILRDRATRLRSTSFFLIRRAGARLSTLMLPSCRRLGLQREISWRLADAQLARDRRRLRAHRVLVEPMIIGPSFQRFRP